MDFYEFEVEDKKARYNYLLELKRKIETALSLPPGIMPPPDIKSRWHLMEQLLKVNDTINKLIDENGGVI